MSIKEKYGIDLVRAEVLRNGYIALVSQMNKQVVRSSFSPVCRDFFDFAATLLGPFDPPADNIDLVAMAEGLAVHVAPAQFHVRNCLIEYGVENLEPGDVLTFNDPYRGGNHVSDVGICRPIFWKNRIVAVSSVRMHMIDMGGYAAGGQGSPGVARDVWTEGVRFGPLLLYKKDKPVKPTFNLFFDNSRVPHYYLTDIQAAYVADKLAEQSLQKYIEKYGIDDVLAGFRYSIDYCETSMRRGLSKLPDGDYEGVDYIDDDGLSEPPEPLRIKANVRLRHGVAEVDFSGTSTQALGGVNTPWSWAAAGVYVAFKVAVDRYTPINAGTFKPIDIVIPPGTCINPLPPAPVGAGWLPMFHTYNVVLKALEEPLGDEAVADDSSICDVTILEGMDSRAGRNGPFADLNCCWGGWGATRKGDGATLASPPSANMLEVPVEAMEEDYPLVSLYKEYRTDSGGPGKNRGGLAVTWDRMFLAEGTASTISNRMRTQSFGVRGGKPGGFGALFVFRVEKGWDCRRSGLLPTMSGVTSAEYYARYGEPLAGMINPETNLIDPAAGGWYRSVWGKKAVSAYSVLRLLNNGGGGYGDPLDRDPEKVKADVRDEYVSVEGAMRDYGVVVKGDPFGDPENLVVDFEDTAKLREEMRRLRGG